MYNTISNIKGNNVKVTCITELNQIWPNSKKKTRLYNFLIFETNYITSTCNINIYYAIIVYNIIIYYTAPRLYKCGSILYDGHDIT